MGGEKEEYCTWKPNAGPEQWCTGLSREREAVGGKLNSVGGRGGKIVKLA